MRKIKLVILFIGLSLFPVIAFAQGLENYIIQNDIGTYKFRPKPTKEIYGNSGVVISADHFDEDHDDISYVTCYIKPEPILGVDVQVTQHTGGDSDRWLLHEVEDNYHDDEKEILGLLTDGAVMRKIDNNRVLWIGIGGGTFRWVRNNVVINVSYTDLQGTKPEPIEVVKAYLAKFPSTITLTDAELKANTHNVQWIKDEMERRLWLCDKWSMQLKLGKVSQEDVLTEIVDHMAIFLNYRQKYYKEVFGMFHSTIESDLEVLGGYKRNKDIASIQKKLTEYKTWWAKHKDKSISLK